MLERRYLVYLVLLVVIVLLNIPSPLSSRVKAHARDAFSPFQKFAHALSTKTRDAFSFFGRAGRVIADQEKQALEVAELHDEIRRLRAMEEDNENLRKMLGFRDRQTRKLIISEVMARGDVSGWWQTVRLDKGTDDGITPGLAVITAEGLVGRTTDVSRRTCDVLLLADPNCRVAARFSRTKTLGVVRGAGVSTGGKWKIEMLSAVKPAQMDYIPKEFEVEDGDEVVTSGLGGIFPEGILIGYARNSRTDPTGLYRQADVVPAAELGSLRYVFVVQPEIAEKAGKKETPKATPAAQKRRGG